MGAASAMYQDEGRCKRGDRLTFNYAREQLGDLIVRVVFVW
jgi:hypothetical protein